MEILKDRREKAAADWENFANGKKARVLVGAATCGRAAGALDVKAEFEKQLAAAGLSNDVDVVETACIGLCYAEPLVEIRAGGTPSVLY
ncbi:MAG: (2Fe-2S) ferredoxin domain-containing protein, partial [Opitutales bacterium]|nr:(2Fe-2S) ferredoxin domain-containing protein [Opitutales bacterium]